MFALALWTREKTVMGVENFVAFCGHLFFLMLTRPNAAHGNFPYTIKTTQIQAMGEGEDFNGDGERYIVTSEASSSNGPDLTALFVTSHESSLSNGEAKGHMALRDDIASPPPAYDLFGEKPTRNGKLPPMDLRHNAATFPSAPPSYQGIY